MHRQSVRLLNFSAVYAAFPERWGPARKYMAPYIQHDMIHIMTLVTGVGLCPKVKRGVIRIPHVKYIYRQADATDTAQGDYINTLRLSVALTVSEFRWKVLRRVGPPSNRHQASWRTVYRRKLAAEDRKCVSGGELIPRIAR